MILGKYDTALDLETRNSLSLILEHMKPGTRVLEFGPAHGRLTRYLKETLGCEVDIVEIDGEAGQDAAAFARRACIGPESGDIEGGRWCRELAGSIYDYILFADVLEHLRMPGRVLRACLPFLAEGGSLMVSVPNVAHNAVILSLLREEFTYTSVGLLDNTHIHLFTRRSFRQMADEQGYAVVSEEATYASLGKLEIQASFCEVPREVARYLKGRPAGEAYQFVFELKKKETEGLSPRIIHLEQRPAYACECFVEEQGGGGISPDRKLVWPLALEGRGPWACRAEFDLTGFGPLRLLRVDPLDANCVLQLGRSVAYGRDGRLWELGQPASNGFRLENYHVFATDDPQLYWEAPSPSLSRLSLEYTLLGFDADCLGALAPVLAALQERQSGSKAGKVWQRFKGVTGRLGKS